MHRPILESIRPRLAAFAAALAVVFLATVAAGSAAAQAAATAPTADTKASVHGFVNDPIGVTVTNGTVKLATTMGAKLADTKFLYAFPTDANGNFKGTDIAPGTYTLVLMQGDKSIDFMRDVKLPAGVDTTVNFDMSREEYMKGMTPEQRKQIEEYKKKNAAAQAANSQIKNLNALLAKARTDMKAGSYDTAIASMQQATQIKPDEPLLWYTLGDAQLGAKKYDDAVTAYKKSLDLDAAAKKPNPEVAAAANNNLGEAYANAGKTDDAVAAFEAAAKAFPPKAGTYYLNEAIILYRLQKLDESAAAADKAIAADPTKVDAYYVKGQDLIGKATVDPKTQKITAPEECIEAYQKYLALAPTGPHAEEIKQILAGIGEKINSSYKASKKK
ncbi:MAG: tetratricopeptide repeat protein [Acidobacteriaceae bacterium]